LAAFRVADSLLATNFFIKFTTRAHMLLTGNTLTNLYVMDFYCESSRS
jgi:DNA mismatch repair protein MSH3